MNFGHPQAFLLLLVVAGFAAIDQIRRTGGARQWPQILRLRAHGTSIECPPSVSARERRWRLWTGLALVVVALASPRFGYVRVPVEHPPREVLVALDLSRSMLARDVKPSRMDQAKLLLANLLDKDAGDRLGLVLFSASSYLQLPLSNDYEIFSEMLPNLSPAYFPQSGTNFAAMLNASLAAYSKTADTDRFLVVVSDGEAFDTEWKPVLEEFRKRNIHIIGIGVGTKGGDVMVTDNGTIRTLQGVEAVSHLDSSTLEQMATATGGSYARGDTFVDIASLLKTPQDKQQKEVVYRVDETHLVERYRWVLVPALLLIAWSFWTEFPVRPSMRQVRLPMPAGKGTVRVAAPVPASVATAAAAMLALFVVFAPHGFSSDEEDTQDQINGDPKSPMRSLASLVTIRINGILQKGDKADANDYVSLVVDIDSYGEAMLRARARFPTSIIDDARFAIAKAKELNPAGGDWDRLNSNMDTLLKADTEPWKVAKADAAGKSEISLGYDPNIEDKLPPSKRRQNQNAGPQSAEPLDADDVEQVKGSFADSPAFGAMNEAANKGPSDDEDPPVESDQQLIGGKKAGGDSERNAHPELILPLQKLEHVRRSDTPAKLFQMLEGKRPNQLPSQTPEW